MYKMSSMKERMHTGELYLPGDEEIMAWQTKLPLTAFMSFNMTRPTEGDKRQAMLKDMFAEIGEGCYIEPPFPFKFRAALNVHFGKCIYRQFQPYLRGRHAYLCGRLILCLARMSLSPLRVIRFCRSFGKRGISITLPCR